eukprot:TRINITY_DN4270_c0_g1_i3.p1 TRINITY_DN4270_c0_g1~~TRINITY_DN4270_c0_g1_i3.p1  ORF type:complete len:153 (+),score=23.92 TRINITY_DN4270_c0_g1_i3:431-889(+)
MYLYQNDRKTFGVHHKQEKTYIGKLKTERAHGKGEMIAKDGSKWVGEFSNGEFMKGSLICADGYSWQGEWTRGRPIGDDCIHPKVKECNEKGICVRTLPRGFIMPQRESRRDQQWFCESCLTNGNHRHKNTVLKWNENASCDCKDEDCLQVK